MKNIEPLKVNSAITWKSDGKDKHEMTGVIVERVRAKVRPAYNGACTQGQKTKYEVSYIVQGKGKHFWVTESQHSMPKAAPKTSTPQKIKTVVKAAVKAAVIATKPEEDASVMPMITSRGEPVKWPDAFKNGFDTLLPYLPH